MSPTPTPEIPAMPDDLRGADGMNPEIAEHLRTALHDYATWARADLDAMLGTANNTSPSPWFWLATATVATIAALTVAAMVVFRPRIASSVPSVDAKILRQMHIVELSKENRQRVKVGLPLIPETTEGEFTFTPANDTDDLPPAPVNLDSDGDR